MRIENIFLQSLQMAKLKPKWWGLAFLQFTSLAWLITISKARLFVEPLFFVCVLGLVCIISFATVFFWTEILFKIEPKNDLFKITLNKKFKIVGRLFFLIFLSVSSSAILRLVFIHWAVFAIIASLLFVSVVVCALFLVVFKINLDKAMLLTADFWKKKSGGLSLCSLILIVGHGFSFATVRTEIFGLITKQGFSIVSFSDTIWLLLVVCILISAILGAILNVFVVLWFLNTIKGNMVQGVFLENKTLITASSF
jgi:hypothetical protein